MTVGGAPEDDDRRAAMIREKIGSDRFLMMDANKVWEAEEAISGDLRDRVIECVDELHEHFVTVPGCRAWSNGRS
jgi:threonine dehydrogenase-like Zn-dependent dehydrogenase